MDQRVLVAVGIVCAVLVGVVPHLWVVDELPQSLDAVRWIASGDPASPDFASWTFGSPHFRVGFRPLLGLSYTLTGLLGGASPLIHRLFDLGAHGACIALTAAVYLRLRAPTAPTWPGIVAAALVALHPVAWFVVPHLARRAYPLVCVWVLLAILAAPRRDEPTRRWGLALAASAAAALTHEAGYAAFGLVIGLSALRWRGDWRAVAHWWGATALVAGVLIAWRAAVMSGVGGYRSTPASMASVAAATIEGMLPVSGIRMDGEQGSLVVLGIASLALGALVFAAAADRGRSPVVVVGAVWLGALFVLFVPQGVWFLRQTYLMVPALGLLVAGLVLQRPPVPAWLVVGLVVARSALWTGGDADTRVAWQRGSAITAELSEAVAQLPQGTRAVAVVPFVDAPAPWALRARAEADRGPLPRSARAAVEWVRWQHQRPVHPGAIAVVSPAMDPPYLVVDGLEVRAVGDARVLPSKMGRRAGEGVALTAPKGGPAMLVVHDGTTVEVRPWP